MLGKIYKIVSPSTKQVYIGSTISPLQTRFNQHKNSYKMYVMYPNHIPKIMSYDIICYGNARIELLKEIEVKTRDELTSIEHKIIANHECNNKTIIGSSSSVDGLPILN